MQQLLDGGADVNKKGVRCARCPLKAPSLSLLPGTPPAALSPSAARGRGAVSPSHLLPTADPIACPRVASTRALAHHVSSRADDANARCAWHRRGGPRIPRPRRLPALAASLQRAVPLRTPRAGPTRPRQPAMGGRGGGSSRRLPERRARDRSGGARGEGRCPSRARRPCVRVLSLASRRLPSARPPCWRGSVGAARVARDGWRDHPTHASDRWAIASGSGADGALTRRGSDSRGVRPADPPPVPVAAALAPRLARRVR